MVYNFCKIETVEDESLNNATVLFLRCAPIASKAIYTTFNSLNVICLVASVKDHKPETTEEEEI